MSDVYSVRFIASHAGAPATFTCPAGFRCVIKCVTLFNANSVLDETGHLIHSPSDCTILQRELGPTATGPIQQTQVDLFTFVFTEGESILTENDGDIDMTVSGFQLSLP
jgi:hypothetical protein